jgi:hypothetical protein
MKRLILLILLILTSVTACAAGAGKASAAAAPPAADYLKPIYAQGYCLQGTLAGTRVALPRPCPNAPVDQWVIKQSPVHPNFDTITNATTGLCLDDQNGPSGTFVLNRVCNSTYAQMLRPVADGLTGQAWQFGSGLRLDSSYANIRASKPDSMPAQAWTEVAAPVTPVRQYFGLGASETNTQANGSDGVYPLSDSYCAARVQLAPEHQPANATANAYQLPAGTVIPWGPYTNETAETAYNFSKVDGNVPQGFTTDEILEWAACKWGMDQNIAKAEAFQESSYNQATLGDLDSCGGYDSYGILQVRATNPAACTAGTVENSAWGGYPYTADSTAIDADAQMARLRAVYDGQSYMGTGGTTALTGGTDADYGEAIWDVVSTWQSGANTGLDTYTRDIDACLNTQCWQSVTSVK